MTSRPEVGRPIVDRVTYPIAEQRTSNGGFAYRLYDSPAGTEESPTFVLLHGIGMSHRYLRRLHRALAVSHHTVSIDLPGFGGTRKPGRRLSVEDYAEVIGEAIDYLGVTSAVPVGHSMGCQFAVELARRRPDQVSHLVLMGPVVDERRRSVWQQALALGLDSVQEPPSANFMVLTDYLKAGPRWYLTEVPAMMDYPTEDRLRDVPVPVLVIRGERDPVAGPDWCAKLARQAQRSRLVEFPGAHVVQQSSTAAVSAAVTAFVATEPSARA
jgi:pimeloyl-ACP methyl ester carboxylesterase